MPGAPDGDDVRAAPGQGGASIGGGAVMDDGAPLPEVLALLQRGTGEPWWWGVSQRRREKGAPVERIPTMPDVYSSTFACEALSWGIGRKCPCMLAEITYRKRRDLYSRISKTGGECAKRTSGFLKKGQRHFL